MKALIKRLLGRAGQRLTRLSGSESPGYLFAEDGLATMHNHEFALQPRFQQAYAAGKQTGSWKDHDLRWRIHILLWCATWAARLPGAFVECGVYRGGFAR